MNTHDRISETYEQMKRRREEDFEEWLARAEIKMLLSLIPAHPKEHYRDLLRAVLDACFTAGHTVGMAAIMTKILGAGAGEGKKA